MQRKPTKNTRGPCLDEKQFQAWIKQQPCCWCGSESGSIVDHVKGATFKHNKVLIGHWFVLPNCERCDYKKTIEGKKLGDYAAKWHDLAVRYENDMDNDDLSMDVVDSIISWGSTWQNGK